VLHLGGNGSSMSKEFHMYSYVQEYSIYTRMFVDIRQKNVSKKEHEHDFFSFMYDDRQGEYIQSPQLAPAEYIQLLAT
jgi:hypothetical protein